MKINNHRQNQRYLKAAAPKSKTLAPIAGQSAKKARSAKAKARILGVRG